MVLQWQSESTLSQCAHFNRFSLPVYSNPYIKPRSFTSHLATVDNMVTTQIRASTQSGLLPINWPERTPHQMEAWRTWSHITQMLDLLTAIVHTPHTGIMHLGREDLEQSLLIHRTGPSSAPSHHQTTSWNCCSVMI